MLLVAFAFALMAQPVAAPPPSQSGTPTKAVRQKMEESIRKQKESVRKQVEGVQEGDSGWFTVPWSNDSAAEFISSPAIDLPAAPQPGPPSPSSGPPVVQGSAARTFPWCDPIKPAELAAPIEVAANREGYSPELLRAVIQKESAFVPCAVSQKGALGLMQLMPTTAAALGVTDPLDPLENLNGGAKYLGQLLGRYGGDIRLALGAYNAGPARVDQYGDVPPYDETQNYVKTILGAITAATDLR